MNKIKKNTSCDKLSREKHTKESNDSVTFTFKGSVGVPIIVAPEIS